MMLDNMGQQKIIKKSTSVAGVKSTAVHSNSVNLENGL